jgi:hypothetical protein
VWILSLAKYPLTYQVDTVAGSDTNDGLSKGTAFKTIQKGIDVARDGDYVMVWPGVYPQPLDFKGKAIYVGSIDDAAIIEAPGDYAVSFYTAEDADSVLSNFIIRGSFLGVFAASSSPTLVNLTVVNNNVGVAAYSGAFPYISNCIFWNNLGSDLFQCTARYSCVQRGSAGPGNITYAPLFADAANGDYHLRSQRGRYSPSLKLWVLDVATSPGIDAGDPLDNPVNEPMPNGARIDMGAHGGSVYASMSEWSITGDFNRDGRVDLLDLAILSSNWLYNAPWAP